MKPVERMRTRASLGNNVVSIPRRNILLKTSPQNDKSKKSEQQMNMYSKIVQLAKLRAENSQPPRVKRKVKRSSRKQSNNASSTDDEILANGKNVTNQNTTKTPSRIKIIHPGSAIVREKRLFQCHKCRYQSDRRLKVIRHLKIHEKPFRCDLCEKQFYEQDMLDLHVAKHKNQCMNCLRRFRSEFEYLGHVNTTCKSKRKRFQCYLCKNYLTTNIILSDHMKKFH